MISDDRKIPSILIVDDVEVNAVLLQRIIETMGYDARKALSVSEAVETMCEGLPDIIITDLSMPEIDGFEFLRILKNNVLTRDIPVIVISGLDSVEEKQEAFELGAVDFIAKPFNSTEVKLRIGMHLKLYYMQQELEEYNKKLKVTIEQQYKKIEFEQKNILVALADVVEQQVKTDGHNHLDNVSYNAQLLAQSLSFSEKYEDYITQDYIETIRVAALLHDVGKIGLSDEEIRHDNSAGKKHSEKGARILEGIYEHCSQNRFLKMAIDIARYHHLNFKSEAEGLRQGEDIPLSARIVRIVGDYDNFTAGVKSARFTSQSEIVEFMKEQSGIAYDPEIIEVFLKIINQLHIEKSKVEENHDE